MADGLAGYSFVRGGVQPGTQHPVAVSPFAAPDRAAIFGRDHPGRVVRHAGQDRDVVAVPGPGGRQTGQASLWGPGLRREIVGHDDDPHRHDASARTRRRASSAGDRRYATTTAAPARSAAARRAGSPARVAAPSRLSSTVVAAVVTVTRWWDHPASHQIGRA